MKVTPAGHRVLIEPEKVKETVGKIVVVTPDAKKQEQLAQVRGKVIAIGKDAFREFNEPWCKVGDTVLYQRHAGMRIPGEDGQFRDDMLLLNDLDITAVVEVE